MKDDSEELVELAEVDGNALAVEAAKSIDGCSNYFEAVSADLAIVQNSYIKTIIE
jgi:hypothetical protein